MLCFFKQKTAYEMRISDWSSDVCSSDLIGIGVAKSKIANSFLEGKEAAQDIGFPLVIRPSYTLGGSGGGFVHKKEEFDAALNRGLQASPSHEVLVEQAVLGWKEFELELLREDRKSTRLNSSH